MTRALYLDTSDTMSSLRSETPASTLRYSRQNSDTPSYCPSVGSTGGREMHALKRGLLWQQRERLFSRWKERFFILTKDYLHCFKKSTGLSPMGQFIFKIKLVDLEKVEWVNKKSYSTIGLTLQQAPDCRVLLRTETGLEDWFDLLEECTAASKERRRALRKLHNPSGWEEDTSSIKFPDYLSTQSGGSIFGDTISVADSDIQKRRSRCGRETADVWYRPSPLLENRLSLLTDIDINRGSPVDTPPPSVPPTFRGRPCRLNNDVFFMAPGSTDGSRYNCGSVTPSSFSNRSVLTPVGSFRSSHLFNPANNLQVKYRERSQSDVYGSKGRCDSENRRASYILPASHM